MKLFARNKSFKKDGQVVDFVEIYTKVEVVPGYPCEIVLSFDKTARQVIANNLEIADLVIESSQFTNDNGEIITYDKVHVLVGSFDLDVKKKLSEAEKYLIKISSGVISSKK